MVSNGQQQQCLIKKLPEGSFETRLERFELPTL